MHHPRDEFNQKMGIQSEKLSPMDTAIGGITSLASGVPLIGTYLDEAAAGLSSGIVDPLTGNDKNTTFKQRYDQYVNNAQKLKKEFSKEHPVASVALPLGMGVYSARASGLPILNPTTPLGMAGTGALLGGTYQSGDNPQDRLGAGILGAMTGGALGYGAGKLLNAVFPNQTTQASEFVNNYKQNKEPLRNIRVTGDEIAKKLGQVVGQRSGASYAQTAKLPDEVQGILNNGSDLYSLDTIRSRLGSSPLEKDIKEGLAQLIGDKIPVNFRGDYSQAMKLNKLDDFLNAAGGDPLKMQTAMRRYATGKNAYGLTKPEIAAAAKAGREGLFQGLFTGKTLPMLTYAVEKTPVVGGLVTGARAGVNEKILNDISNLRNTITGDVPQPILTRAGRGLLNMTRKNGRLLNR